MSELRWRPWSGLLLALLCVAPAWAQEAPPAGTPVQETPKKAKKDFFGQASLGEYNARDDAFGPGSFLGNRYGWYVHPLVHAGIEFDWYNATESQTVLQGTGRVVHDAEFDYFPLLGYVQLEAAKGSRYIPYVGAGAGYQLAFVEGSDYETEILDGWGWGCWAGIGFQIRNKGVPTPVAVGAELFYHSAEVSRMADVPGTGVRVREFVDAGGIGASITFRFRLP